MSDDNNDIGKPIMIVGGAVMIGAGVFNYADGQSGFAAILMGTLILIAIAITGRA
jgi:hypothetical protein